MSALESPLEPSRTPAIGTAPVVAPKTPIALGVITGLLALLLVLSSHAGQETTFRLATRTDLFEIPAVTVPTMPTSWLLVGLLAAATAWSVALLVAKRRTPLWLVVAYAVVGMLAFLTWAAAGGTLPVVGLLGGALALAIPLVFGALCGVLGERSGVINIAIDSQLLFGAFAAALAGSAVTQALGTGSETLPRWSGLLAGLAAAMVAGMAIALVLAVFSVSYGVDQIIVGVVLNVLVIGLTSFLFTQVLAPNSATLNSPPRFPRMPIPLLGDIPLVGPIFFRQTLLVYLMYAAVPLIAWALYRSKWGLRVRAVGEHPKAADTVGVKVLATRYRTLLLAGVLSGIGGATYTLVAVSQFNREMTGGAGFIALAAMIFGKWDPIRATLAALLFGFASNLQGVLSVLGSPVPSQFMLMLPYVVTIFAVAGLVGHSRPPSALNTPYTKG
ncbi:ABC transporter permease [Nocardioides panacisoli]|uniref:ABC transporter permease n=1 Tax=Nocardioides panacisoli TaxID=627624 RepID=UPI001C624E7E|nr:ABC transporter permease [Nocardioides panacisoli]QYJ02499.1 ABC transporter permease [Nocardioides panacisoli]